MEIKEAWRNLIAIAHCSEEEIDLAWVALLLAATNCPGLDIAQEIAVLDSLAAGAAQRFCDRRDPLFCINTLSEYIFDEVGFRGNNDDYYDPRNSYLNEVLTRRVGIPITLSLVYIEVGRRLDIPLLGVGMPGHFMVRHCDIDDLFVDPFHGGILLTEKECVERVMQVTQADVEWDSRYLAPIGNLEFISRMVRNLKGAYLQLQDYVRAARMIDWLLEVYPDATQDRRDRGIVRYQLGNYADALDDLRGYLASQLPIGDAEVVGRLIAHIEGLVVD